MITLKQYLETIDYRITEGTDYGWNCYGPNAAYIDGYIEDQWSASAIFDRKTQVVYEVQICDYRNNRCYKLYNPEYRPAHEEESKTKNVDSTIAWDDVKWIELETEEDMLEKMSAIVEGRDYDTRIRIPLDLPRDDLFELMKEAHERDITLNQLIIEILEENIRK